MQHIKISAIIFLLSFSTQLNAGVGCGIYSGNFRGSDDFGQFFGIIDENDLGAVIGYNIIDDFGFAEDNFSVNPSTGNFTIPDIDDLGTDVSGTANGTTVSGTYTGGGTFNGTVLPDTGTFQNNAGMYEGTFSSVPSGCFGFSASGTVELILAANGSAYFYTEVTNAGGIPDLFVGDEDGGSTTLNSNGTFSGSTVFGTSFSGTLNTSNNTMSGTVLDDGCNGTFSLSRTSDLPACSDSNDDLLPSFNVNTEILTVPVVNVNGNFFMASLQRMNDGSFLILSTSPRASVSDTNIPSFNAQTLQVTFPEVLANTVIGTVRYSAVMLVQGGGILTLQSLTRLN